MWDKFEKKIVAQKRLHGYHKSLGARLFLPAECLKLTAIDNGSSHKKLFDRGCVGTLYELKSS